MSSQTKPRKQNSPRRKLKPQPSVNRGDKLLCIDDQNLKRRYVPGPVVKGHLYCVREVFEDRGEFGVLLVGIEGPIGPDGLEQGFKIERFRWVHR